ncbi:MAG: protein kinase, partial [Pyrinomonadaceae bacterium]|nr:protein kinase [Pyrinomonadaceae bacterium]
IDDITRWADELLDALDYLHTQSTPIVHRDIKPQNLKLTPRGEVILLDFGLAKNDFSNNSQHTNTKSLFGFSKAYAPLEQIQGNGTDLRSDLYSLAATLYHLATGKPAVDALTRATSIINKNIDPLLLANEINPKIPFVLAEILRQALSLNADSRPISAAAMRELFRQLPFAAETRKPTKGFSDDLSVPANAAFPAVPPEELESVVTNVENVANVNNVGNAANINDSVSFGTKADDVQQVKPLQISIEPRESEQAEVSESKAFAASASGNTTRRFSGIGVVAIILVLCGGAFAAWYATKPSKPASAQTQDSPQVQSSKASPTATPAINVKSENTDKSAVAIADATPTPNVNKASSKELTATPNKATTATLTTQPSASDEPQKVTTEQPKETQPRQTTVVRSQPNRPNRAEERRRNNQPPQEETDEPVNPEKEEPEPEQREGNDRDRDRDEQEVEPDGETRQRRAEERRQRRESKQEIRRQRLEEVRRRNQQPLSRFPF